MSVNNFKISGPYNPLRIGIDVDGVLANFNYGCCQALFGKTPEGWDWSKDPDIWDWPTKWGASEEDYRAFWDQFNTPGEKVNSFWGDLPVLASERDIRTIEELTAASEDIYYITHRPPTTKLVTERWINDFIAPYPTVLLSRHKGHIARGLNLHCIFDDKPENLINVLAHCQLGCIPFLINSPWNKSFSHPYIIRVDSITEGIKILKDHIYIYGTARDSKL